MKIFHKIPKPKKKVISFVEFIREQGVVGLAVGFILGGAVSKIVASIVTDLINPLVALLMGATGGLTTAVIKVGTSEILIGHFIGSLIDFVIIAAVVFFIFKGLRLEKLDKKKS